MPLSDDLLEVARALARLDSGRPRQATLRRAVSTAYYGAFHSLLERVGREISSDAVIRSFVSRGVSHSGVRRSCASVASGNWPVAVTRRVAAAALAPPGQQLKDAATAFLKLQQQRHAADYDTLARFKRSDVLLEISRAAKMVSDVDRVMAGRERSLFLLAMLSDAARDD